MKNLRRCPRLRFAGPLVLALLLQSACSGSEERDRLVSSTWTVQTYIGTKPWQKCELKFDADGKARWEEDGKASQWNYDVSGQEIMLALDGGGRTMQLQVRDEGLYGNPCGGNLKRAD